MLLAMAKGDKEVSSFSGDAGWITKKCGQKFFVEVLSSSDRKSSNVLFFFLMKPYERCIVRPLWSPALLRLQQGVYRGAGQCHQRTCKQGYTLDILTIYTNKKTCTNPDWPMSNRLLGRDQDGH